ncbi:hypothetical protein BESB_031310 [Besnoitia besnoiti]|uniref:Uncharacterized protein n=1 Tax=Besnoitia besnoiti TaxID=94643 RepID=A0A2A9M6J7_BESBE|nr:hypothetical protein BESB_031310 [Besnoitia besnoiti]PFH31257.1 hypothetical protein BESB_031310 [Besnoitia besnoiti]
MPPALSLEEQYEDLLKRFQIMDSERKTTYEAAQQAIKYNQSLMKQLKEENVQIRNQLKELKKNKILTAPEHFQRKVDELSRLRLQLDQMRNHNVRQRRTLASLQDKLRELEITAERPNTEASPELRRIRVIENRLDQAMIKLNEAQSIRSTYEQIVKRLKDERLGLDQHLAQLEKNLKEKENEYEELLALSHDATHARELAQASKWIRSGHFYRVFPGRIAEEEAVALEQRAVEERMKGENAQDSNAAQADDAPTLEDYESIFHRIKEATGVSDVNEVIQKFLMQGETRENLVSLAKELEETKLSSVTKQSKWPVVDDLEISAAQANARHERARAKYEKSCQLLVELQAGLEHLYEKLMSATNAHPHPSREMRAAQPTVEQMVQASLQKLEYLVPRTEEVLKREQKRLREEAEKQAQQETRHSQHTGVSKTPDHDEVLQDAAESQDADASFSPDANLPLLMANQESKDASGINPPGTELAASPPGDELGDDEVKADMGADEGVDLPPAGMQGDARGTESDASSALEAPFSSDDPSGPLGSVTGQAEGQETPQGGAGQGGAPPETLCATFEDGMHASQSSSATPSDSLGDKNSPRSSDEKDEVPLLSPRRLTQEDPQPIEALSERAETAEVTSENLQPEDRNPVSHTGREMPLQFDPNQENGDYPRSADEGSEIAERIACATSAPAEVAKPAANPKAEDLPESRGFTAPNFEGAEVTVEDERPVGNTERNYEQEEEGVTRENCEREDRQSSMSDIQAPEGVSATSSENHEYSQQRETNRNSSSTPRDAITDADSRMEDPGDTVPGVEDSAGIETPEGTGCDSLPAPFPSEHLESETNEVARVPASDAPNPSEVTSSEDSLPATGHEAAGKAGATPPVGLDCVQRGPEGECEDEPKLEDEDGTRCHQVEHQDAAAAVEATCNVESHCSQTPESSGVPLASSSERGAEDEAISAPTELGHESNSRAALADEQQKGDPSSPLPSNLQECEAGRDSVCGEQAKPPNSPSDSQSSEQTPRFAESLNHELTLQDNEEALAGTLAPPAADTGEIVPVVATRAGDASPSSIEATHTDVALVEAATTRLDTAHRRADDGHDCGGSEVLQGEEANGGPGGDRQRAQSDEQRSQMTA